MSWYIPDVGTLSPYIYFDLPDKQKLFNSSYPDGKIRKEPATM